MLYNNVKLFRLQKYKKFESNSQQKLTTSNSTISCFDCKSTKNLRAIHNMRTIFPKWNDVVSTAKVQKIWEQFTTIIMSVKPLFSLFRLQKYKKFESNSQHIIHPIFRWTSCFDCKSTKNLRAIHNPLQNMMRNCIVVSTAKVQKIWEQFTTVDNASSARPRLFRLQKYKKFESNSQQHFR